MTTILAIARKEARRQVASPSSWLIVGLFALLSGGLYIQALNAFLDQSAQALAVPAPQPINVNQLLVRPLFVRIGVAVLLVLPLVLWRLTRDPRARSPESRVPDFLACFSVGVTIYLVMLLVTTTQIGLLFMYGRPEWPSILTAYLGLLLFGLAFMSLGFLISVIVTQPVAAIGVTAALGLLVAAATWLSLASPTVPQSGLRYFSMADKLDDFAKGVIDTGNVIFYVSLIAVSLLLATRSLKSLWRT